MNLCAVSTDEMMSDQYGRQLYRSSSVIHASRQSAPGNYWRRPNETGVKYTPPAT